MTIAAAFPGMFTWEILMNMCVREKGYWLRQADAIRRQAIANMAHAVNIGMASGEDANRAMDELELSDTKEESMRKRSEATWNMLFMLKGGTGV